MAELVELALEVFLNRKSIGRKQPILFCEQSLFGKGRSDCAEFVVLYEHRVAQTLNSQRSTLNVAHRPAAICFSASFTNSSVELSPSFSCNWRTIRWASTCL